MAIQVNLEIQETGLVVNGAYVRIKNYAGDLKGNISLFTETYASHQARLDGLQPVSNTVYQVTERQLYWVQQADGLGGNAAASLYGFLKEQPGFETAIDV